MPHVQLVCGSLNVQLWLGHGRKHGIVGESVSVFPGDPVRKLAYGKDYGGSRAQRISAIRFFLMFMGPMFMPIGKEQWW